MPVQVPSNDVASKKGDLRNFLIRVRRSQPEFVKKTGRAIRVLSEQHVLSPAIDDALLSDCRVLGNRYLLIDQLPKGGVVGEVGVDKGEFADHILRSARPSSMHLFDIDFSRTNRAVTDHPAVIMHRGLSADSLDALSAAMFDWIYVDGDHSYEGVCRDCQSAKAKVKPGGYLVFNDFALIDVHFGRYGVHRAVSEFLVAERWPVRFFAFDTHGLYDIAIQKPLLAEA
jgi:SAM-dependent methyltransferase